jgi:hypothetical protein
LRAAYLIEHIVRFFWLRFFLVVVSFVGTTACRKDHRVLESGVLPSTDSHSTATYAGLDVFGYTSGYRTVSSFNERRRFLGYNNDPVFGAVQVGLYTNMSMPLASLRFSSPAVIDAEVILKVDPNRFKGSKTSAVTYSVFPIEKTLAAELVYLTSDHSLHASTPIAVTWKNYVDTIGVLHLGLDKKYFQDMLTDSAGLSSAALFRAKYKGFYITASASDEGLIFYCDVQDQASGLYVYYTDPTVTAGSHKTVRFSFAGEDAVSHNTVSYDPLNASPELKAQLAGDTVNPSHLFLHGLGVSQAEIRIPSLQYSDTFKVAVNRAEVVFHFDEKTAGSYLWPPALALLPVAASGADTLAMDQSTSVDNFRYNGVFDLSRGVYTFNITRHAQAILSGETRNRGFRLVVADPDRFSASRRDEYFERVVLKGNGSPEEKPTFNLTVVRLNR